MGQLLSNASWSRTQSCTKDAISKLNSETYFSIRASYKALIDLKAIRDIDVCKPNLEKPPVWSWVTMRILTHILDFSFRDADPFCQLAVFA